VTRCLVRCLIYVRISMDDKHDAHGVANQMAMAGGRWRPRGLRRCPREQLLAGPGLWHLNDRDTAQ
jgi:hypothetical protein